MVSPSRDRADLVAASVAAPWGLLHVAATARGIVAVELMTTREAFTIGLQRRLGRSIRWIQIADAIAAGSGADAVAVRQLRAAVAALEAETAGDRGDRGHDPLARVPIDIEDRPAWDRAVLEAVRAIPRGTVRSYGEVARAIGRPGAARAVGGAVGRNPVGLLVPCHRVVAGDGTLGGYGGGWWGEGERLLDLKAELLAQEGVVLPRSPSRGRRGR